MLTPSSVRSNTLAGLGSRSGNPPALFADQDADARGDGKDWQHNAGLPEAEAGDADDSDENQIDGEEEHADVFGDVHVR